MLQNIIYAIGSVFFVIGLVTVISFILIKALIPEKKDKIAVVSVFGKDDKNADVKISCIVSILSALGIFGRCKIIAVDDGMEKEQRERLFRAFQKEKNIKICTGSEISEEILKNNS